MIVTTKDTCRTIARESQHQSRGVKDTQPGKNTGEEIVQGAEYHEDKKCGQVS